MLSMPTTSARRQPYFQRVSVPGMSPHFEPTTSGAEDDSFFHPRPRQRPRPTPAPMPTSAPQPAPAEAASPTARDTLDTLHALPTAATARPPVWDGLLDAASHMPGAHQSGRRGAWILAALLVLAAGVGVTAWREMSALWSPSAPQAAQAAQSPLRVLLTAVDECRGSESLLVMMPVGTERDETLQRLVRQQQRIDAWLRDHAGWLEAAQGPAALAALRDALTAWRGVQQQVIEADVQPEFDGRARASRSLMSGPSGEAYRRVVALLGSQINRQPD
jgi:hypothetical protein